MTGKSALLLGSLPVHQNGYFVWCKLFFTGVNILFNIGCCGGIVAFVECSGGVARLDILIFMLANDSYSCK